MQNSAVRGQIEALLSAGRLDLADFPAEFMRPTKRMAGYMDASRVKGILVGAAIGDALGNTSESMTATERQAVYGEIRDYLPNPHADGRTVGLPSDDTQLTVWTLESLLAEGGPNLPALASAFQEHQLYGIGRSMRSFLGALKGIDAVGDVWDARQRSAGNGALMRVAGAFLPHAWTLDGGMLQTVALTSALTHDHASSTAACVAFARILGEILWSGPYVPNGYFWETYVDAARQLEGARCLRSRVPGDDFCGSVWELVARRVPALLEKGLPTAEACNSWYSGAFLLETVPTVLFILERYKDDPEEALVRAVMDTWDNDTVASIVGSVLGALHGEEAFPLRWRTKLLGRTSSDDDGRVESAFDRLRQFGGYGIRD